VLLDTNKGVGLEVNTAVECLKRDSTVPCSELGHIKVNLKEEGYEDVDLIHLAQDRVQ
jgi:hypothetical protein